MASIPITVLLYNGPLLCGFNTPIEGLSGVSTYAMFMPQGYAYTAL